MVESGTLPGQRVVIATLEGIVEAAEGLSPPALVVIGGVVALAGELQPDLDRVLAGV